MGFNTIKKHHYLVGRFLPFLCQKMGGLQRNGHPKKGGFQIRGYGSGSEIFGYFCLVMLVACPWKLVTS